MKQLKKGISLIVLVITVIVLTILTTIAIITVNRSRIINKTSNMVLKSDIASYQEIYSLYLSNELMNDNEFDKESLNVKNGDSKFNEIFGDNVKEMHADKLQIVKGKLLYFTEDQDEVELLEGMGVAQQITPTDTVKLGALVDYTPTANPNLTYSGATYEKDTVTGSATYNTYVEKTINTYKPGSMTWVYLGQDANGNILLTSQDVTSFTVTIGGQDGWATGPDRIDTLCNVLYGNNTYGVARNMKVTDVNRVLGYPGTTGHLGTYQNKDGTDVKLEEPITFETLETELGEAVGSGRRYVPRIKVAEEKLSEETDAEAHERIFKTLLTDYYTYAGVSFKAATTDEYKIIFNKGGLTTKLPTYWLSNSNSYYLFKSNGVSYRVAAVANGAVNGQSLFISWKTESEQTCALRPVIVLNSNIQFGEENGDGELTLVETLN